MRRKNLRSLRRVLQDMQRFCGHSDGTVDACLAQNPQALEPKGRGASTHKLHGSTMTLVWVAGAIQTRKGTGCLQECIPIDKRLGVGDRDQMVIGYRLQITYKLGREIQAELQK